MDNQLPETSRTADHRPEACIICGCSLSHDEIALTRKLINRGAREFLCIDCLAHKFNVPQEVLQDKIVQFKEMGCTLFR